MLPHTASAGGVEHAGLPSDCSRSILMLYRMVLSRADNFFSSSRMFLTVTRASLVSLMAAGIQPASEQRHPLGWQRRGHFAATEVPQRDSRCTRKCHGKATRGACHEGQAEREALPASSASHPDQLSLPTWAMQRGYLGVVFRGSTGAAASGEGVALPASPSPGEASPDRGASSLRAVLTRTKN